MIKAANPDSTYRNGAVAIAVANVQINTAGKECCNLVCMRNGRTKKHVSIPKSTPAIPPIVSVNLSKNTTPAADMP